MTTDQAANGQRERLGAGPASRRTVLKAGVAAAGIGTFGVSRIVHAQDAGTATPISANSNAVCVLTPELTEGPYYLEGDLIRKDITEGKPGLPLKLKIAVMDPTTCAPLANAAVDVWHCDAQGYYSGVASNNPGPDSDPAVAAEVASQIFLRGIQLTDENGIAEIDTIYPGWYLGRTVHIHMKVEVEGNAGTTYEDGHVSHTGQIFFDDAVSDVVYELEAYGGRDNSQRTRNDSDNIFGEHGDEPGFLLELEMIDEADMAAGMIASITVGVDPSATPAEGGMDGAGGPPPGEGGAPPPRPGEEATPAN